MASKKKKQKAKKASTPKTVGSVMVVGGGIAGTQAALDLANSGYYVYLVEKSSAIGGVMAQLDKTFPTNDCSMCILSPKLVECGRHLNIELITMADVEEVEGHPRPRPQQRPALGGAVDQDAGEPAGGHAEQGADEDGGGHQRWVGWPDRRRGRRTGLSR